jgi:hypothetical protein
MIRKLAVVVLVLLVVVAAAGWFLSAPQTLSAADLPNHKPDLANGAYIFQAGGCESCHAAPDARGEDLLKLAGGRALASPFGTFHAPNISPDPDHGIGKWSLLDFVNAMKFGVAPNGTHLYPAFPYVAYQRLTLADIIDLKAYRRVPHRAERDRRPGEEQMARRRARPRRQGLVAQHHARRRYRHRQVVEGRHRSTARNRLHAGFRCGRRRDGRRHPQHVEADARGPRRDRRLPQVDTRDPQRAPAAPGKDRRACRQ